MILIAIVIFLLICIIIYLSSSSESFRGGRHNHGRGFGWRDFSSPFYYDPYGYWYEQQWARARLASISRYYPYQSADLLFK